MRPTAAIGGGSWKEFRSSLRFLDFVFLVLSIGAFVLITVLALRGAAGTAGQVVIDTADGSYIYSLDTDRTIEISGPIGVSVLEIKNHKVSFVDSPCRDKICVHMGEQSANGQWAACLPNRVFFRISSTQETQVDAQLY